ncbi:hypothetical protein B0I35DRAFT_168684 [Stachybotrys elegans]|uniref:FHA domain-containing protein n=1 Tax=Stachybotrys elegans TaxID=80388 RepID=A0A8K0WVQ8_9HYPO|nr:hypothetical protein B0I35DRAFT_168684 [Stachybotrys elegans]
MDSPSRSKRSSNEPTLPVNASFTFTSPSSNVVRSQPTGSKRSAPSSLLPPFEPLSSSPALPRPVKRQNIGNGMALKYPTPVPTSSTGILSSSPPRRTTMVRNASERAPLSAVPTLQLPENGEAVSMGRSSNSSTYQLSANRLVSRVHVRARYIAASNPLEPNKIEIVCTGWNGIQLHSQGRTWELFKGDSFTSETEGTELMVDVQDARVMIQWPKRSSECLANLSDSSWDDSPRSQTRGALLQSSPLRRTTRISSPVSPSPANTSSQRLLDLLPHDEDDHGIKIYEDEPELPAPKLLDVVDVNASMRTEATLSFSSDLSDLEDEHDPDEENDPIVHSFGPFGANISNRMASISTRSPQPPKAATRRPHIGSGITLSPRRADRDHIPSSPRKRSAAEMEGSPEPKEESRSPTPKPSVEVDPAISNHVINQLAFSRLSSTPLSSIMDNLPADVKTGLSKDTLRAMIESTACIGIITRVGKDAAGKALESQYYYLPENDDDEQRRAVVDGLRKPTLRNCRKQHKQYYWKRPRTP